MYKVIHDFVDFVDDNYRYKKDDIYPRNGVKPSDKRCAELSGSNNKAGFPLIKEVVNKKKVDLAGDKDE